MSHEYVITAGGITLANQPVTLIFLNPPAAPNVSIRLLRAWISQTGTSTSGQQRVQIVSQVTAFPTLVTSTPVAITRTDAVSIITGNTTGAAGTCGINASAEGGGSKTVLQEDAFNVLNGWLWVPTPRETWVFKAGSTAGVGIFLPAAATSLTNWSFGLVYGEE